MSYGDDQQAAIATLHVKVTECREQYKQWRRWCKATNNLAVWEHIGPAIITKADYYKGEITRAKHNLARYMMGRDPEEPRYPGIWLEDIDYCLRMLPEEATSIEQLEQEVRASQGTVKEINESFYASAMKLYKLTINSLTADTEFGRNKIYAGSV